MALRIGIVSSCQHESLAVALAALLPDADIFSLDMDSVANDPAARDQVAASLAACDHVISQDASPDYGKLSTRALHASARNYHLIPAFHFGGFHPDCVAVRLEGTTLRGPAGGLHSRIAVTGLLAGLSADETTDLFNPLVFARLGYFDALAEQSALLTEKFAAYAIDLSPVLPRWRQGGCFMTSPHHPKMVVFLDLARIACAMMGLAPQADPPVTSLPDRLAAYSTMPLLPELAARWHMLPEGVFRDTLPARPLTLSAFVQGSYKALARAPLSSLRATQGVSEALARLVLRSAARAPRGAASGPNARCLITWHGTIVRIEAASSLIVQEQLSPPGADCTDFIIDPVAGADGGARADILGGLDITKEGMPGTVSLRRQSGLMRAEAGRLAMAFKSEAVGRDETFLMLGTAALAQLRDILAQDWAWEGTSHRAAAARIRLRQGFVLDFAVFAINLTEMLPTPVPPDAEGRAGYVFQTNGGPITIRANPAPERGREIALLADPQRRLPNEAGSIPAFRTALRASWSLTPPDEIMHPPVTRHDLDTAWLFERCILPGGLPSGLRQHAAALRRMPNRAVLLCPGMEGMLFDAAGTMGDTPPPVLGRRQVLPRGLRQEEGALLIETAAMAAAPLIDEPVAVCLSPEWGDGDGWLIDVALRLHVMAPFLPRGTRLLVPPGFAEGAGDRLALLEALGLGQFPTLEAPAAICRLADAVWLDQVPLACLPAALLRGFRERIAALFPAPAGEATRLYIKRTGARSIGRNDALDVFLAAQNVTTIVPAELPAAERIAAFRRADMVIGAHGEELANIVFCQDGTRVLEISPRGQFRPRYWMLAEKCGLIHGVLPSATTGGGFDSVVQLDVGRLRGLYRVLRLTSDK